MKYLVLNIILCIFVPLFSHENIYKIPHLLHCQSAELHDWTAFVASAGVLFMETNPIKSGELTGNTNSIPIPIIDANKNTKTNSVKRLCGIYKITNPKRKIYIGQSVNIMLRTNNTPYRFLDEYNKNDINSIV